LLLSCLDFRNRSFWRTWFLSPFTPLGLIAISVPMRNGSNGFWLCPDIIIGTIRLKKSPSTKILRFISRGLINFLGLITFLRNGRKITAWPAKKSRPAFLGKRLNLFWERKDRKPPKNLARPREHPWVTVRPCSLPSPSPDTSSLSPL